MEVIKQSPDDLLIYEARLKRQRDESTAIQVALMEGKALGRAEGEQIGQLRGRAEGEQIGQLRGRAEGEQIGQVRGEQIGQVRGEQIGQIRLLEQILGLRQSPTEELATLSTDQLAATVENLRRRLETRNQN